MVPPQSGQTSKARPVSRRDPTGPLPCARDAGAETTPGARLPHSGIPSLAARSAFNYFRATRAYLETHGKPVNLHAC